MNNEGKGKLMQQSNQQQPQQFPKYGHVLDDSNNTCFQGMSPLKQIFVQNENDFPQIFNIGGNKKLNKKLYLQRKQKIKNLTQTNVIQCRGLGKEYLLKMEQPVVALKDITLCGDDQHGSIKKGQFVIIRGPSGGGKTTFLNMLGTIDSATSGQLRVQNQIITSKTSDQTLSKLRRQKIGIVFQTFNLLALMTAYQNIQLPMRIQGKMDQKCMRQRTKMLLKKVGLSQRADHLPSQLSGGQQQRVAIARSLSNSPSIILLDQPTGDLDSKSTIQVMNLLLQINNYGYGKEQNATTIVMVTHNQDLECYGDRLIFFEDGKIKKQILNQYQFALDPQEYSQFLNTKI